jgi:hypothetical protein
MEHSNSERFKDAPDLTLTRSKTAATTRIPRHHERWLIAAGFAVRHDDGRLRPTAHGDEIGAALFGYSG